MQQILIIIHFIQVKSTVIKFDSLTLINLWSSSFSTGVVNLNSMHILVAILKVTHSLKNKTLLMNYLKLTLILD